MPKNFKQITKFIYCVFLATFFVGCAVTNLPEDFLIGSAKANNAPIFWHDLHIESPNSQDGKKISWRWQNISEHKIKSVNFDFDYFNNENDPAYCTNGPGSSVRQTGPFLTYLVTRQFKRLCYDSNVTCGELASVEVNFMNGSSESYSKKELLEMNAIDTSEKCGPEY